MSTVFLGDFRLKKFPIQVKKFFTSFESTFHVKSKNLTHLDRINVMRDNDQLRFLLFNEFRDRIGASTDDISLLRWCFLLSGSFCLSFRLQTVLLRQFRLRAIFFQQFKQLNACLLVQRLRKLVDWRRDLQAFLQNCFVTLDANVFRPPHETWEVTFGLDVVSYFAKKEEKREKIKLTNRMSHFFFFFAIQHIWRTACTHQCHNFLASSRKVDSPLFSLQPSSWRVERQQLSCQLPFS